MNSQHISRLCAASVLCVLTVSADSVVFAQDSGGLGQRVFQFLDKNKDGQLDTKEFAKAPVTMRNWLTKNRHKPSPALKKDDFLKVFDQMMTDLRNAKPVDPRNSGASAVKTGGSNGTKSIYASGQEPVEVGTTASPTDRLPAEYQPGDSNKDGQIDFAEWRKWKTGELAKFRELDKNNDSVLSPIELGASSTVAAGGGTTSSPSVSSKPVEIVAYDKLSDDLKKKFGEVIKKAYFDYLDENKSGKLESKEWAASERISKAFKEKKVDLTKDMTPEQFVTHYSTIIGTSNTKVWNEYLQKNPPKTDDIAKKTDGDSKTAKTGDTKKSGDTKSSSKKSDGDSFESLSDTKKKEYQTLVKGYFDYLDGKPSKDYDGSKDGNKDGKLQPKEWAGSSRIKKVFADAKIDLTKEMTETEFISHYTRLVGTKDRTWRRNNRGHDRKKRR